MTELHKYVFETLSAINSKCYLEKAKDSAVCPYIVFRFPTSVDDFQKEDFILEVDVWDNLSDTTRLEALVTSIDTALHSLKYYESGVLQTCIYRLNRLMLPDPDEKLRRRQLRYICKTYL